MHALIRVVNFPFCNFFSLERYLRLRALPYQILCSSDQLTSRDIIILPGVGTFGAGMEYLNFLSLVKPIKDHVNSGGKVVGICLGMQMFLQSSAESPGVEGLGLIPGACELIPSGSSFSVPHIGWNELKFPETQRTLFAPSLKSSDFYFVHSYYAKPLQDHVVIASFEHPDGMLAAAISSKNIMGFQFHPEKSGSTGYALLDQVLLQ